MAATASSLASISADLKQRYLDPNVIQNAMIDYGPMTAKLLSEAATDIDGGVTPFMLIISGGGGFSSSPTAAAFSSTPAASVSFAMTRGTTYAQILLGGEAMKASEKERGAFIDDLTLEIETKKKRVKEYIAALCYSDGTGAMAQVGSISTATSGATQGVVTLADPALAAKFQVNDCLNCGMGTTGAGAQSPALTNWVLSGVLTTTNANGTSDSGTGAALTYAQVAYVIAVNVQAGTITLSKTQGGAAATLGVTGATGVFYGSGTSGSIAAGSFLFFHGDAALLNSATAATNQAVPSNTGGLGPAIVNGWLAWCPPGGPVDTGTTGTTGSFYAVNRNNNSQLYGQVVDATAAGLNLGTIRAALTNQVAQLRQVSSKPKRTYLHPIAYYKLSLELQSQGMIPGAKGQGPSAEGSFGFSSMVLPTEAGDIEVIADPQAMPCLTNVTYAPTSTGYSGVMMSFMQDDNWEVISLGDVPYIDEEDGNFFRLVQPLNDTYLIFMKAYWALGTHRPNGSSVCFLPQ
jgi:hypothetical protein